MRSARALWAARWRQVTDPASLGAKLVLILTAVGIAGAVAITLLLASVITPSFNRLEAKAVGGHVERTDAALAEFAGKAESAVRDYGDWNDSYAYMADGLDRAKRAKFERDSFSLLAMTNLGVQGMAYVASDGRVVIARWPASGGLRDAFVARIRATDLARVLHGKSSRRYYVRLNDTVAAIGVAQVRRSDGTGTPRGWVLMARTLTSQQLSALLQLNARIAPATATDSGAEVTTSPTVATIAVPILGADGRPVASARFGVPRDVSLLGHRMLLLAVAGSTLLLLLVLLMLRRIIGRLVLRPLARVEAHMQRVSASGSLNLLGDDRRRDEIGSLGRSLNAMLRQLHDLREQIEVQSFALGRSESAVAVMHNVRNALNPISTILSQGVAQAPAIDRAMLDRALGELAGGDIPAARRQKLVAFVAAAIAAEGNGREAMQRELGVGREAMAHVLEIIGQQQKKAHERPQLERVDVAEIVARNATIARYSEMASIAFTFPSGRHLAMANRVILSQVIGNLLGNAAEAIAATGRRDGAITVSIVEAGGHVVIRIADDGEGFAPDIGATLFQRGFSTRQHKSGGLGLHWCANSMVAMEGSLALESEGAGRGATAVLTLGAIERDQLAEAA